MAKRSAIILLLVIASSSHNRAKGTGSNHTLRFDDGNLIEAIPNVDDVIVNASERGFHLGRLIIQPVKDVASGTAQRIGKMISFVKHTAGLDTNTSFTSGTIDQFKRRLKLIYPGTQWCGDGNKARFEDDLGKFEETDKCCRAHDQCADNIEAGADKYGLHNGGLFTRSHCSCDTGFYTCLKNSTELTSTAIGVTYFTVLRPQCFREDYLITGCKQYSHGKCINYHLDETKGRFHQWFDNPTF